MAAWQDGATGLIMAALYGREAMVQLLLKHKADVRAADKVGTSELHQSPRGPEPLRLT